MDLSKMRMIGVFGKREMEIAAVLIVDARRAGSNDVLIQAPSAGSYEAIGVQLLWSSGYLQSLHTEVDGGKLLVTPTPAFWEKVQER